MMERPSPCDEIYSDQRFRKTFIDFTRALDVSTVSSIVGRTLKSDSNKEDDEKAFNALCSYVNWDRLNIYTPLWLNSRKYVSELFKLSSPDFWRGLLNHADESAVGITYRLGQAFIESSTSGFMFYDFDTGYTIAQQNLRFYGLATAYLGLAAVYGPRLALCTKTEIDEPRFQEITQPIFKAGQRIGSEYVLPPINSSELIDRLQMVFSPAENDLSGYKALLDTKAFGNWKMKNGHEVPACPAVKLTKMIFADYQNLLRTEEYRNHINDTITRA